MSPFHAAMELNVDSLSGMICRTATKPQRPSGQQALGLRMLWAGRRSKWLEGLWERAGVEGLLRHWRANEIRPAVRNQSAGIRWALLLERHCSPRDREGNHAPEGLWQRLAPTAQERRMSRPAAPPRAQGGARLRSATTEPQARLSSASRTTPFWSMVADKFGFP